MSAMHNRGPVESAADASLHERAARFFGPPAEAVSIEFGALTHTGKVRSHNEDHYGIVRRRRERQVLATNLPPDAFPPLYDDAYVLAVADGIGGASFGEVASMLALRTGWELTTGAFKWHFNITERESEELLEMLKVSGQLIHERLRNQSKADPRLAGMGSTITGALMIGFNVFLAHVGDSRAYLFRNGELERLTRDHTVAQKMVDQGLIESITDAPRIMRHALVNCLGGNRPEVEVDTRQVELAKGDWLLLCSDGLTDMVPEPEIIQVLTRCPKPQEAAAALIEAALEHGGKDNVTVVLARYPA